MQVAANRPRAVAGAVSLVLLAASIAAVAPAGAAISEFSGTIGGPGATRPGKAVELTAGMTNSATKRGVVPDLIKQVRFTARGVRFNGRARGVKVCKAKPRRDSYPTRCPRGSEVGSGRIASLLGAPGESADRFGVFSRVTGRFKLYNYRARRGDAAGLLAVIDTSKPFGGVAINLVFSVDRKGTVTVPIPRLSELPRIISRSYPKGTPLVLTELEARISTAGGRPFAQRTRSPSRGIKLDIR